MNPILKISNLQLTIAKTNILNGITFSVSQGEHLGIVGPNGSGKTSLFNCISGFNEASFGTIYFQDKDLTKLSPSERAKLGIGRVFQSSGIFREMSVIENVIIALEARKKLLTGKKYCSKEINSAAIDYLEKINLAHKHKDKAGSLSGGQMRLLEITRTIAFGAELFLLDEPTSGVSPKMKDEIKHVLRALKDLNKTVLIIEHDMNFIQDLCGRIIVLDSGTIALDGTTENIRIDPRLRDIYFGTDFNSANSKRDN